ncbi:MAG: phytanoyl-CoA dioxygenase [Phycisphaeraceae bacterium]|nr:phytanoyl-CoA dioxygenase [Phycisphaeraceae bacterium]
MTDQLISNFKLTEEQCAQWESDGYLIVRGLFDSHQVEQLKQTMQNIADKGEAVPGWQPLIDVKQYDTEVVGVDQLGDVLKRYPRFLHPHRYLDLPREMMLDPRVHDVLLQITGEEPVACQSMYYFKPCGAKGQALHQDNLYLQVEPNTCYAAWTAIDPVTPENGGLYVVPGSHTLDTQCPTLADETQSFTTALVDIPKGMKAIPTVMQPGDVLFFNGQIIHGSGMNRSKTLWRRSFICHYMPKTSKCVSEFYFPIVGFDGSELTYEKSQAGGPCGEEFKDKIPSSYSY